MKGDQGMLTIVVPESELFDEFTSEISYTPEVTLTLEHSLVSLSKWESKWEKPFLSDGSKSVEETLDYIRCMTLTEGISPEVYTHLSNDNVAQVSKYIEAKMSATWFTETRPTSSAKKEVITAEVIYYWMIALTIPFECETWHLNRLLTLVRVCNLKNAPAKKMSRSELASRNRALNEQRLAQFNTNG